jgi:citrate lyase subunit gamma (acyl carrier protein)
MISKQLKNLYHQQLIIIWQKIMEKTNLEVKKVEIKKYAVAGTTESSDIMIVVEPSDNNEVAVTLNSSVEKQYGDRIEEVIIATLKNLGITSAKVSAVDKGALDCTIEARTVTAIHRAAEKDDYNWKEMDSWNV